MMKFSDLLIVIPAKLGSERVERKNLQMCGGKTLLERAIDFARDLAPSATLTVSTESAEVAAYTGERGVPHIIAAYPPRYHGPTSHGGDVWGHAWRTMEEVHRREFPFSLYLEPSSPLREVVHAMQVLGALGQYRAAWTVEPVPEKYWSQRQWGLREGSVLDETRDTNALLLRQDRQPRYVANGAAYGRCRPGFWNVSAQPHLHVFEWRSTYAVVTEPLVNIDTWDDLREADRVLSKRNQQTEGGD